MPHNIPATRATVPRKSSPWLLPAVGTVAAGLGLVLATIVLLGSRLHRLLAALAGGLVGAIKDHQEAALVMTGICVCLVWCFIALVCAIEWRRERKGRMPVRPKTVRGGQE